jgi:TRAP transporter TAXI family solute receptor
MKKMGFRVSVCLGVIWAVTFLLMGYCPKTTPPLVQAASKAYLTIGGGGKGGALKARTEAVAEAIRRGTDYQVTVLSSDVTTSCLRMAKGEQDLAFVGSYAASLALRGEVPFSKPIPLRLITHACLHQGHIVVLEKTGLTSLKDAIEKKYPLKISVGKRNGYTHNASKTIWKAHGGNLSDLEKWGGKLFFLGQGDTVDMLADGTINAAAGVWGLPTPRIVNLGKKRNLKLLTMDDGAVALLEKEGFLRTTIPARKYYSWMDKEILSIIDAWSIVTVANAPNVSEEISYNITKALYAHKDYLISAHRAFGGLTVKDSLSVCEVVPFHEGAERYYRETGAYK